MPLDQAGRTEAIEHSRGLVHRPAHQLRALHGVEAVGEPPVEAAGFGAEASRGGEGIVGAPVQSVGQLVDERGPQRGAGAGGARVRL